MYQLSQRFSDQGKRFDIFKEGYHRCEREHLHRGLRGRLRAQQHGKYTPNNEEPEPEERRAVNSQQLKS